MSTFRFVHAAHLHLDAPMRGIDAAPASLRAALRDASIAAWDRLVDLAIEREAAFVLIGGGLIREQGPTARAVAAFIDGIRRLHHAGISTFVALGEDDAAARDRFTGLAPAATIFDQPPQRAFPVVSQGVRLATIHAPRAEDSVVPTEHERGGGGLRIALAPADAEPEAGALRRAGIDYWAGGRTHRPVILGEHPWIVGSGTPQGRAPVPDEAGPKGAFVVEVEDDQVRGVGFVELDRVRFVLLEVDASHLSDPAAVARDSAGLVQDTGGHPIIVADVALRGDAPEEGVPRPETFAHRVLSELRRGSERPYLWWNAVRDSRTRRYGKAGGRARLANVVSDRAQALAVATLPRSSFLAERFAPLRRVWDAEIDLSTATELVREAAAVALDALQSEALDENPELVD